MKKILYFIGLLLMWLGLANSQNTYYQFSIDQDVYADLNDPILLSDDEIWGGDVAIPLFIPIGFDFYLFDHPNDSLISVWGSGLVSSQTDMNKPGPILYWYESPLVDRGWISGIPSSPVSYQVDGSPGDRIFKLEIKNAGFLQDNGLNDYVNVQLWLYEGTNDIEIRFGPNDIQHIHAHYPFEGPLVLLADGWDLQQEWYEHEWSLFGDPSDPVFDYIDGMGADTLGYGLNGDPADGTVYRFKYISTSISEKPAEKVVWQLRPTVVSEEIQMILESPRFGKNWKWTLSSTDGKVIRNGEFEATGTHRISVSELPEGMYFISLWTDSYAETKRFMKIQ